MNWDKIKKTYFSNTDGMLIDFYFDKMDNASWQNLFSWLRKHPNIKSINCYDPKLDENLDVLPNNLEELIGEDGFYCFVSIIENEVEIILRYYSIDELEGDVSPAHINNESKFIAFISTLDRIQKILSNKNYIVCPENSKEMAFISNGNFIGDKAI